MVIFKSSVMTFALLQIIVVMSYAAASSLSTTPTYHVPSFTVQEIQSGNQDDKLRSILTTTGLFAIRVPLNDDSRSYNQNYLLSSLCQCQPNNIPFISNGDSRILADGLTTRSTIATASQGLSTPISLPKNDIIKHCNSGEDVYDSLESLRDYVSYASKETFIPLLDRLIDTSENQNIIIKGQNHSKSILLSTSNHEKDYTTFDSIVEDASHLEHFHLYSKEKDVKNDIHRYNEARVIDSALDWHSDGGLFLAFIPGTSCRHNHDHTDNELNIDESFRIKVPYDENESSSYQEMIASFPQSNNHNKNEIIVAIMLGAGSEHWLNTPESLKLRATQHTVKMKGGDVRAWYGMMHLVPSNAIVQQKPIPRTFAEMKRSSQHSISRTFSDNQPLTTEIDISIGCGNDHQPNIHSHSIIRTNRRLQHVTGQNDCIGSSNYFCWMSCLALPEDGQTIEEHFNENESLYCLDESILDNTGNLTLAVEACSDPSTGTAGGVHNAPCHNVWYTTVDGVQTYLNSQDDVSSEGKQKYCYGSTAMYMQGFEWEGTTCVAFLFSSWIISSRGALVGACFGVAILSVVLEIIIRRRRSFLKRIENAKRQIIASALLYAVQVTIGYAVMLVVMTYSGPLVLSVIIGLAVGHAFNNRNVTSCEAITSEGLTPCCQYGDQDLTVEYKNEETLGVEESI